MSLIKVLFCSFSGDHAKNLPIFSFACVPWIFFLFFMYLRHFLQCNVLNLFTTWTIKYIKLIMSHLRENFQDEIVHQRTFPKKSNFDWALCQKNQNVKYIWQNQKNQRNIMGFNNNNLFHKIVKHWALK